MLRFAVATFVAISLWGVAHAQELSAEVDKTLWCGSAFFWLGSNALDSGAIIEAKEYDEASNYLMNRSVELLKLDGLDTAAIEHVMDAYDNAVVAELGTADARHDVTTCLELIPKRQPR